MAQQQRSPSFSCSAKPAQTRWVHVSCSIWAQNRGSHPCDRGGRTRSHRQPRRRWRPCSPPHLRAWLRRLSHHNEAAWTVAPRRPPLRTSATRLHAVLPASGPAMRLRPAGSRPPQVAALPRLRCGPALWQHPRSVSMARALDRHMAEPLRSYHTCRDRSRESLHTFQQVPRPAAVAPATGSCQAWAWASQTTRSSLSCRCGSSARTTRESCCPR
jgi:hypothetical protein